MTTYTTLSATVGVIPPCDYLEEVNNLVSQLNTNAGNITNNGSTVTLGGTTAENASVSVPTVSSSVDYITLSGSATGNPALVSIKADGTDSNVGILLTSKGTGVTAIGGSTVANSSLQVTKVTSSVDFVQISGDVTGTFSPAIAATGTDTDVNLLLQTKGSGVVAAGGTTAANASLQVATVASSVDFVKISGDVTATHAPVILATGTDTNVSLLLQTKGSGVVAMGGTTQANSSLQVATVASSVDYILISGDATATHAPSIAVAGTDSNISLVLTPKGTGLVQFGTAGCFTANGSVATSVTSVGPTGSRTTVQKWLTINDSAGNPFYIPCF